MGHDHQTILSDDGINLSGIEVARVDRRKDESGKFSMMEIPNTTEVIPCDMAFLAVGFSHPAHDGLINQLKLELDKQGNVSADAYHSSIEKIFTAGDMRRGQSLVVWAIAEGRECAEQVHDSLRKKAEH